MVEFPIVILGSGAAGLTLALHLADRCPMALFSKAELSEGNTFYAQGGISAVLDQSDSIESHIEDTLRVGCGLCDPEIVRLVVSRGREAIEWLLDQGVQFTIVEEDGQKRLHLTREGGHSHRRVVHAADATGREVETSLLEHARCHPNIHLFDFHTAIDLITTRKLGQKEQRVVGVYVYDRRARKVKTVAAKVVVLATGGAGKVYLYTSNPNVATGDGIAMAWRAGCRVANMEFIQFHPTCLYHPKERSFLISEALRGEGARLLLPNGEPFMHRFDPRGELAPRDVVARAIDHEIKRLGIECVYLDISHKPAGFIQSHFPTIYKRCLELGIDITREPIPVVPAAHYICGGVLTDRWGRTDIPNLYAIGEVACTGLHGANRMASNSLLECFVFAKQAAADIARRIGEIPDPPELPEWDESRVTNSDEEVVVTHNWQEIRRFMWDYVGIVRTNKRLERALHRVELLKQEIQEYYGNFRVTNDLLELRNLIVVAELIVRSALQRKESRGLHWTLDYPAPRQNPPLETHLIPPNLVPEVALRRR